MSLRTILLLAGLVAVSASGITVLRLRSQAKSTFDAVASPQSLASSGVAPNAASGTGPDSSALAATPSLPGVTQPVAFQKQPSEYDTVLQPFLAKYCNTCHNDVKQSAGLILTDYVNEAVAKKRREVWLLVADNVASKAMPPKNGPQPTQAERDAVLKYLTGKLTAIECGVEHNPGRVTLRRLNRAEYNNTIRDLIGIDFTPADDFPSDDVGYGFDNIGDVLSLPPILLEKYLNAAEQVMNRAIVDEGNIASSKQMYRPQNLIVSNREFKQRGMISFHSNGTAHIPFNFPGTSEYIIRIRAWGDLAGPDLPRLTVRLEDKVIKTFAVNATPSKPMICEVKVRVDGGTRKVTAEFDNDYYEDVKPRPKDRNLYIGGIEIEGPLSPVQKLLPESHQRIMIARPTTPGSGEIAARKVLTAFVTRAYRRPAKPQEIERLLALVRKMAAQGERFEEQIRIACRAVLVSPHFLFRVEADPPAGQEVRKLNDYELASRLSYFLWSSMPDAELFRVADRGELSRPEVLQAQVKRMLADPKSRALVENFAGQWLQLRNLQTIAPDRRQFRGFDESLRDAMRQETERFFEHVMRENRSVLEFLDSDYTFVNDRLAKHYGFVNISGSEFRKVKLPDARRGGILTHASVLTVTSNPTRTSPVKRGKWVLDNILGTPPPPPPPDVPELEDSKQLTGTLRQKMEQHRANPTCASCHQRMDPLGFGFENFDAVGAWRSRDGGDAIDPSGVLPAGEKFQGPAELRKILLGKADLFRRCLAEKMLTFSLGRGLEFYDKCALDEIVTKLKAEDDRFAALVMGIVQSEPFQKRRNKRGE
ncbi:DUF1592 domain-containing protein [Tuwongella immobilis]|uniref:Cytochrome c domain-containing protein n=1 Tax=Tuwongella immobilis TaxID=692036 RepID=A0A6C2YGT8_9BACT|nr:DUF1592 domain-containing protein [Tuwongella immobilis]VIP00740.1 protein containing duf1592 : Uncharacterized protein OS=Singulisphaera acidiphila (strain ATCC BAA-1392 / DSM 18658 / VKM B-2454 / MOB10) GN=Sinac_6369 PE=4 SV=1: Cytochrome_CBB3: PSD3: PSD5: PSD4: PSCyt3: PSD2 [Tuwongella immobilis]VTR96898.1 protein containing duf1592 : Uncharacterized protein OS=Singulisphaera acidiphila (strain ATCC BAA-1392 / DSM 18658 / VKM B-2454 / MOB10) GN=Sinac_6369 PE=4 SV=1: Cytochrome_CBB3: PSD3: P